MNQREREDRREVIDGRRKEEKKGERKKGAYKLRRRQRET